MPDMEPANQPEEAGTVSIKRGQLHATGTVPVGVVIEKLRAKGYRLRLKVAKTPPPIEAELTLASLIDALSEVLLTEFPSTKAARLAAALVRECREPEPDVSLPELTLKGARAMPKGKVQA